MPTFDGQNACCGEDGFYTAENLGESRVVRRHFEDLVQGATFGKGLCVDWVELRGWFVVLVLHAEAYVWVTTCPLFPDRDPNFDMADIWLEMWVCEEPKSTVIETFYCALDFHYIELDGSPKKGVMNAYHGDRFSAELTVSMLVRREQDPQPASVLGAA